MSGTDFETFWPYVSNVWVRNRVPVKETSDSPTRLEWWHCKFGRAYELKGHNNRMRSQTSIEKCEAWLKLTLDFVLDDEGKLTKKVKLVSGSHAVTC